MLGYDYPLPLSMASAPARPPIPCLFLLFVSLLQARWRSETLASTPGLLGHPVHHFRVVYKETSGSPKFPGYLSVKHAPLFDPGGVLNTRPIVPRTAAFHPFDGVGFPAIQLTVILLSTIIQISRLNDAACFLAPPGFGLPLPG